MNRQMKSNRHDRITAAAPLMLKALKKLRAHHDDIGRSNPGYLGKLVLQDYALFNEAMILLNQAIAAVEE